ncbi:MAG: hypothetical protein ACO2OW_01180 [Minisyncoccia bacterium]
MIIRTLKEKVRNREDQQRLAKWENMLMQRLKELEGKGEQQQ